MVRLTLSRGLATIEVIIALAIVTIALSAATLVASGNAQLLTDGMQSETAENIAEDMILTAEQSANADFHSSVATSSTQGIFKTSLSIIPLNNFEKEIRAQVSWSRFGFIQQVNLQTLLATTDTDTTDTCDPDPTADWSTLKIVNDTSDLGTLVHDPTSTYTITGLDVLNNTLTITANADSASKNTFFIFDATDPQHISLNSALDNATSSKTGPAAVTIAHTASGTFAYLASASSFSKGQLQIVSLDNPPTIVSTFKIPTSLVPKAGTGESIFYHDGYVYLGLSGTSSPEFIVINVTDPTAPFVTGSYSLAESASAILVRNSYAYIAHPAASTDLYPEQMTVLNISDPSYPYRVGGFYFSGGILNAGKSLDLSGSTLYLGRLASKISGGNDSIPEFYSLDMSNPSQPTIETNISLPTPESIHGLFVRGTLAFLLETDRFEVWNIAGSPSLVASLALPSSGGIDAPVLDCEGNYFYIGVNDASNKGHVFIITQGS